MLKMKRIIFLNLERTTITPRVLVAQVTQVVNHLLVGIPLSNLGFIKFGSRVDLFLPLDSKIKIELDQVVKGAEDIIAEK